MTASDAVEVHREPFVHLVDLAHDRVLIAWGAFWFTRSGPDARWEVVDDERLNEVAGRSTCIGNGAEAFGPARVEVRDSAGVLVAAESTDDRTWAWLDGLEPDTEYRYTVLVDGQAWASGPRRDWCADPRGGYDLCPSGRAYDLRFRTWPHPDAGTPPVRFVALGDFGVGTRSDSESTRRQRRVAEVLDTLVEEHDVRFVLGLGDNVYQGEKGQVDEEGGGEDDEWYSSFFSPYRYAIARVPFYPAIGNHDTTDSEGSDDRAQMEDNFHISERFSHNGFPTAPGPALFYRFRFGRDLELVCLDTSQDSPDEDVHRFFQAPAYREWLEDAFTPDGPTWRVPFSHHPVFCAGPSHDNDEEMRSDLVPLFERSGVRLVLAGHEHNFQLSEVDGCTYVVSGAGGSLREEVPEGFDDAGTTAWSAQAHLLLVEIDGEQARLTPISGLLPDGRLHSMTALTPRNEIRRPPFVVQGVNWSR